MSNYVIIVIYFSFYTNMYFYRITRINSLLEIKNLRDMNYGGIKTSVGYRE